MNKHLISLSLLVIIASSASAQAVWKLKGNSDVTSSSFLGAINSAPLRFYTDNKQRMQIDKDGRVIVGSGNSSSPSALFEVTSANQGVLLPRMTQAQRNAIAAPAQGLLVYQKDGTRGVYYYEGGWQPLLSSGSSGFANTALSNLTTTAINQDLVPDAGNTRNLGSSSAAWNNLYLDGNVYLGGQRFLSGPGDNTFTGKGAGLNNTGVQNTATGYQALINNTGIQNTATGCLALVNNSGGQNTANGYLALTSNTTGYDNDALGAYALEFNTTGYANDAVGYGSLNKNTTGILNSAIGYVTLFNNSTGGQNSALGAGALLYNTTGNNNTAQGIQSMYHNTTGHFNTANGSGSLIQNTTGNGNTAMGTNALYNNNKNYNTGVGYSAGSSCSTCTNVTFLGSNTDAGDGIDNATAVGHGAIPTADNTVQLGNAAVVSVISSGTFVTTSDGRFKRDLKEEVPGLEFINKLRPVTYHYKIHELNSHIKPESKVVQKEAQGLKELKGLEVMKGAAVPEGIEIPKVNEQAEGAARQKDEENIKAKEAIKYTGFVAQEVEEAARKVNYNFSGVHKPSNSKDVYGLSYAEFVVPLVKAVQELSSKADKVDELEKKVAALEKLVTKLTNGQSVGNPSGIPLSLSMAYLEQSTPNPSNGRVIVPYYIPGNAGSAKLVFADIKGSIIKTMNVSKGKGQINLANNVLAAGSYTYTLYVDNVRVDSKQMVISR